MVSLVDLDVLGQHCGRPNSPTFSVPLAVDTPHWQTETSASRSAAVARVRNWVSERESEFEFVSVIDDPRAYGVAPNAVYFGTKGAESCRRIAGVPPASFPQSDAGGPTSAPKVDGIGVARSTALQGLVRERSSLEAE